MPPQQVLYVKNLGPRVTMKDLVSLFARFQQEDSRPIQFRLLSGRMRGQAFITFPGELCLLPVPSCLPPPGQHRAPPCCRSRFCSLSFTSGLFFSVGWGAAACWVCWAGVSSAVLGRGAG